MAVQDGTRRLAEHLADLMPAFVCNGGPEPAIVTPISAVLQDYDGAPDEAMRLELEELLKRHPEIGRLAAQATAKEARQKLSRRLEAALRDTGTEHIRAVLEALVLGTVNGRTRRAPSSRTRKAWYRLRRAATDGWLARQTAAACMNLIIAAPVAVCFFTVWGGLSRPTHPAELAVAGLKVFAIWALSFLPGWLYVRFLGQRAGSLRDEYVLNLHRLGWDLPQFLPRPPRSSQFYREWQDSGGARQSDEDNIYRKKFSAYYGHAVASKGGNDNFAVRIETMFPVFLATAVLATGWTAILWDTSFTDPSSTWQVLEFAFLGAYAFITQSLIRRFFQSDLRPSAYASAVLRIVLVLLTMAAVHPLLGRSHPGLQAATAFAVGFFPVMGLQAIQRAAAGVLRVAIPQLTPDYPLSQLDGLNIWYEARLVEEAIEDMENLASANLVDVILHTRAPVGRLVDWVDQALLYLHLDRVERGRRGRGARRSTGGPGSSMRMTLRRFGIRTATDLLKAFPPDQIDPRHGAWLRPPRGTSWNSRRPVSTLRRSAAWFGSSTRTPDSRRYGTGSGAAWRPGAWTAARAARANLAIRPRRRTAAHRPDRSRRQLQGRDSLSPARLGRRRRGGRTGIAGWSGVPGPATDSRPATDSGAAVGLVSAAVVGVSSPAPGRISADHLSVTHPGGGEFSRRTAGGWISAERATAEGLGDIRGRARPGPCLPSAWPVSSEDWHFRACTGRARGRAVEQ